MVIDGTEIEPKYLFSADFEGDRIRLPHHIVQLAENSRLAGTAPIESWLIVVGPGRYRLLARSAAEGADDLSRIINRVEEVQVAGHVLDGTDSSARAAIVARLIPCVVSPPRPSWRVSIPRVARQLAPDGLNASFVFVMIVAGFIEIWFPDALRQSTSPPISDVL